MSLSVVALIAWLVLAPVAFAAMVALLPSHLHRRATRRLGAEAADVVQLQVARDRRRPAIPARSSRAL